MSIYLISVLQKSFSEKSYQDIAQHVDINPESTKNGVKAIIPIVLASILGNNTVNSSSQPDWWNALDKEYPYSDDEFIDTSKINNPSFLMKGRQVLLGLLPTNYDELVTSVSSVAGTQKEKAGGLVDVAGPLIMGYLKIWMLKKGWKFKDLIANLIENKPHIIKALPIGVLPSHFAVKNIPKDNFSETIEVEISTKERPKKKKNNITIWVIGLLVLTLMLWYFMGSRACT